MENINSIFTRVNGWANQSGAINLGQGFPDHAPPVLLLEAVKQALQENHHQYVSSFGLLGLRNQISTVWNEDFGVNLDPETQITVTAGATQALHDAISSLVEVGDEVVLLDPSYDSYAPVVRQAGAIPVRIPMEFSLSTGFYLNWDRIRKAISSKTKLWILNNPHNPTGYCLHSSDYEEINQIMENNPGLHLLGDEVYAYLVFEDKFRSFLDFKNWEKRVLVVHSFGKTYHCTGWKLGYAAGSSFWNQKLRTYHEFNVFCVNSLMQRSFEIFLPKDKVRNEIARFYLDQRNFLLRLLDGKPFGYKPVQGTYFQWIEWSRFDKKPNDIELAKEWALKAGLAMIPFSPFMEKNSTDDPVLMRLCFAKSKEKMSTGLNNLFKYLGI
jgi:methionine aminotransferase